MDSEFKTNIHWHSYHNPLIKLDSTSGKLIAYVRCNNHTTEENRFLFFQEITLLLESNFSFPIAGKIARRINDNNLCAFLFYCNYNEKEQLKSALMHIKPFLSPIYQSWFNKSSEGRILTWNWRWKSNQQTINEINNGSHWTYKVGLREKTKD